MENKKQALEILTELAVETGEVDGYRYLIVPAPMESALNGYVVFPKKPVRENDYNGILSYVPVHGGITYCHHEKEVSIYGFDTLHIGSNEYPRSDKEWIKSQIQVMLAGILKAAEVEVKYLKCVSNRGKAKWAQMVQDIQPEQGKNFGVMINLLSGKL